MLDEYNDAIETYHQQWHEMLAGRNNKAFFESLKPTSIGWKTADAAEFNERFAVLRDLSDQVHMAWVNERWLATFHLKGMPLMGDMSLIKLMQRRPGLSDVTGLDHVEYLMTQNDDIASLLDAEPNIQWYEEKNGDLWKWITMKFDGHEAKLRPVTVLQDCVDGLTHLEKQIASAE